MTLAGHELGMYACYVGVRILKGINLIFVSGVSNLGVAGLLSFDLPHITTLNGS